jgi:hypothetical protein
MVDYTATKDQIVYRPVLSLKSSTILTSKINFIQTVCLYLEDIQTGIAVKKILGKVNEPENNMSERATSQI